MEIHRPGRSPQTRSTLSLRSSVTDYYERLMAYLEDLEDLEDAKVVQERIGGPFVEVTLDEL